MSEHGDPLYDVVRVAQHVGDNTRRDDPWTELTRGRPLGKRIVMPYDAANSDVQPAPIEFFQLGGFDRNAVQMQIVLSSPFAIPRNAADLEGLNVQNATGEYSNASEALVGDYPGTDGPIIWPPVSALIEWGTNARVHAIVDVRNGTTINISASWLRVQGLFTADAANAPGTSGLYVMSAFASPGWPSPSNAQRTIFLGKIASGDTSDVFAVPPFARAATIIGSDGTNATITNGYLNFWQAPDGTRCVGSYFVSGNQPGPFRVPNGGQYFSITPTSNSSLSGSEEILYSVIFDLAIG